jgi:hypothetical protein
VVFGVLGNIAVLARFRDGADDLGARYPLQMSQFLFQAGVAVRRHWDLGHLEYPNSKKPPQAA